MLAVVLIESPELFPFLPLVNSPLRYLICMGRRAKNKQGEPQALFPTAPKQNGKRKATDESVAPGNTPKKAKSGLAQKGLKGKQRTVAPVKGNGKAPKTKRPPAGEDEESDDGHSAPGAGDELLTHKKYVLFV